MIEKETVSYLNQYFLLIAGIILLVIGSFMVLEVNAWTNFGTWFAATITLVGILMIGSRAYSTLLGVLFLVGGGIMLFPKLGFFTFLNLTIIFGWCLIVAGSLITIVALVEIWQKASRPSG